MRSPSMRSWAFLLGAVLAGCGGGSPAAPTPSLPALERLAIAQQVVLTALGGLAPGTLTARSDEVPLSSLVCEQACSGSTCTVSCPVDEQIDCPGGGTATDTGIIEGTTDANLTGEATLQAQQNYTNCRTESGVTLNGDPHTSAVGTARFVDGELAGEQSLRATGAVLYESSDSSGRCEVDLQVTFTAGTLSGAASGNACGEPVDVAF